MRNIAILGSTGSIGRNTLDVIRLHRDAFSVIALSAFDNVPLLLEQAKEFQVKHIVIANPIAAKMHTDLIQQSGFKGKIHIGTEALCEIARTNEIDTLMAAIVGAAGLPSTLAAAKAGKRILLANKEALVMAGDFLVKTILESGAELLPVDSEHNAIFQCLTDYRLDKPLTDYGVRRLILTASGGPFRNKELSELHHVSPEEACAHPNWRMGQKISVDSATMMNKGLEVIEAKWLFNAKIEQLEVILQPQSIIHSMVEYIDGSVLAELGLPDMRTPIAHVLGFPTRIKSPVGSLDFATLKQLEFFPADYDRFPCLALAFDALKQGGGATVVLNAANEIAVEGFLSKQIRFTDIARVVAQTMDWVQSASLFTLDDIMALDAETRLVSLQLMRQL